LFSHYKRKLPKRRKKRGIRYLGILFVSSYYFFLSKHAKNTTGKKDFQLIVSPLDSYCTYKFANHDGISLWLRTRSPAATTITPGQYYYTHFILTL
jgi:hypothetical protein